MSLRFEWDTEKAATNLSKHGVSFEEALTIFSNPLARIFDGEDHSSEEEREIIICYQCGDRYNPNPRYGSSLIAEPRTSLTVPIHERPVGGGSPYDLRRDTSLTKAARIDFLYCLLYASVHIHRTLASSIVYVRVPCRRTSMPPRAAQIGGKIGLAICH